jgi:hypothetical protein
MRALRKRDTPIQFAENSDSEFDIDIEEGFKTVVATSRSTVDDGAELVVERLLGVKTVADPVDPGVVDDLFLVKWKGKSYLHVSWERQVDIERVDLQVIS